MEVRRAKTPTQLQNNGTYVCNTSSVVCIKKYLRSVTVKMNIGKDLIQRIHFSSLTLDFSDTSI